MAVEVIRNTVFPGLEPCALCGKFTPMWYVPGDVALCPGCAETASPSDIPTKAEWFRSHRSPAAALTRAPRD